MVRKLSVAALLLSCSPALAAPDVATDEVLPASPKWGIEVELIQPFVPEVHIISVRVTRTLWGVTGGLRGDLMLGVFLRPDVTHDVVETIDEYLLAVGYRQYLWRGLHAEAAVLGGWAWGTNNRIDGEDYSNPSILVEANLGYRFAFLEPGGYFESGAGWGLYATPQFGVIAGAYTDIGPRGGKTDVFVQGKLLIGVSF